MHVDQKNILLKLFQNAVEAVKGDKSVSTWLSHNELRRPTHILAVGKAATAMFEGLPTDWRTTVATFLVTKTDHIGATVFGENVQSIESSHPVPDHSSLDAGKGVADFVANCEADSRLLMLVSGGASALVEHLEHGVSLHDLETLTRSALADGLDIGEINHRRRAISAIKGGRLLKQFRGAQVVVLAISDVAGDSIDVIGSGIGARPDDAGFPYQCNIVASNKAARGAVAQTAKSVGIKVISNNENMYEKLPKVASMIAGDILEGPNGLYIYGGEPTVTLPQNPGNGGRNQALALEIAGHIRNRTDIVGLVAGTDGTDGPTDAAGALLDGKTYIKLPGAKDAQICADSGSYLSRTGDQINTGPTGTNVMDLAIFLKYQ